MALSTRKLAGCPLRERGDALIFCIAVVPLLLALLAVGFDLPKVVMAKSAQESALSLVREGQAAPAIALVAKNSSDPGLVIAKEAVRSVRASGYADAVEVWFYEVPEADLPANKRAYGYEVALRASYDPVFARVLGAGEMEIASSAVSVSVPYSESAVWRPSAVRCGVYSAGTGASSLSFTTKTYAQMPAALKTELASSLENAPS